MSLRRLITLLSVLILVLSTTVQVAAAPPEGKADKAHGPKSDNLEHPLGKRQAAAKQKAREMVLTGKAKPKGKNKVVEVAKGQFVELALEGEDQILTLLADFGTQIHPVTGGDPGPVHNQIPEPDRTVDNTTIWVEDFNRAHYEELLYSKDTFPSMANFYLEQSSGRYSVDGYVSDWVQVPYNEARYGTNICGGIVCSTVWDFVNHQADAWWAALVAEQGSAAAANAFLATFDVWDRYDLDGDGNFDEPDGYIDHFQSVHAGEGEETGGGAQGEDAIWSHRWYAWFNAAGPDGAGPHDFGGLRIGNSDYWIGDYTVEPENGGVGVFAHEFAHDSGLPDLYDTSGNTGGAENSTAWWTIMSQGSYGSQSGVDIGSAPMHFSAWEKFQLGWLNYEAALYNQKGSFRLGPAETNTKQAQGLFVILPPYDAPLDLGPAAEGTHYYWSDFGPDLDNTMTREVTLPDPAGSLTAKVRYDIETDWDYAYVTVNGEPIETNLSTDTNPNGQNFGHGITGSTGGNWVDLTADLSAFAGQTVTIGFRYWTDPFVNPVGFMVDAIQIPGQPLDGAEAEGGWTFDGFKVTDGQETQTFNHYYLAEFRQYRGYDKALEVSPYNFGWLNDPNKQNLVEFFPYQDGMLVWYWNTQYTDNNVGDHPGEGLLLPVDAHPTIETWADGSVMRPRLQSYDSTFGLWPTDSITLHNNGVPKTISSKPANPVFDDTASYWTNGHPGDAPGNGRYQSEWSSVDLPGYGVTLRVVSVSAQGGFMQVNLNN
ncbi:MAG TPA: immune inhibitor A domain-containing protein [candidate division Zixibacteria bacterium]|nr:immune inhibitor A domain-containing protein [candidate division Zixibacteria bacterium]